jgi:hypothetical protein
MTDYHKEHLDKVEAEIRLNRSKQGDITARHFVWAVVCMVALVGTALIISRTVIELAKIHVGAK